MRNTLTIATALLLASASLAGAQQPAQNTTPPTPAVSAGATPSGSIDFGFRGSSTTGDRARYERYRDLRNGANVNLDFETSTDTYTFAAKGTNIGYLDQNVNASFTNQRVKLSAFFNQTPLNYGLDGLTKTPWVESSKGVWTLSDAAQSAVQNRTAVGVLCAPGLPAGSSCTPATASLALSQVSVYRGLAQNFDLKSRRDSLGAGVVFSAAKDVDFDVSFSSTRRTGYQPFGMSFAFNNGNELPLPLDNRTNQLGFGLQWGSTEGSIRIAYERSMFDQRISSVTWDNPVRLTDYNDGGVIGPVDGPWDPSAYSNGNGPGQGRIATPPSNTLDLVSVSALAKMPAHSTVTATMALTSSAQNAALIPWTINPVIANAATYAFFPGLAALPRATTEAKMAGILGTFNFTTRPARWVSLNARYRYSDRKDRMPEFDGGNTVRFDGVPEPGPYRTEPFNATWSTANADVTFTPVSYAAVKIGVGHDTYEHSSRAFKELTDTSLRASVDTLGNQYVQLRGQFERTRRVGSGFNEEGITGPGGQEASRMFDDAERTRDRSSLILTLTPVTLVDVTASFTQGKDDYDETEQQFGLGDTKNTAFNVGVNVSPSEKVTFGANYGQDKFNSYQASRTANPITPGAAYQSWTDPNRNWALTNDEKVNNFDLYLDLLKAITNTDLRFAYTYSDSDNAFVHSGPRIIAMQTNRILTVGDTAACAVGFTSCFEALPNVTNTWQRASVDLRHFFTPKVGVGVAYQFEKLEIVDYATINIPGTDTPRIDYLGSLTTGYGNRPYKGNTGFVRLIYLFGR